MDVDYDLDLDYNSDCDCDCADPSDASGALIAYRRLEIPGYHTGSVYPKPELKFFDFIIATNFDQIGRFFCLNQVPSGTGVNELIGNQITISSVSYNFYVGDPDPAGPVRVALVWDRQPNGAVPASYSVLYSSNPAIATTNVYAHLNPNARDRFVILKTFTYPSVSNGTTNYETGKFLVNMKSTYTNGTAGTIPQTGSLLVAFVQGLPEAVSITGQFRIRYYDN